MGLSLNISKSVLLSLHMQHDIVCKDGKFGDFFGEQAESREVVTKGSELLNVARSKGVPIVHVAVCFEEGHEDLQVNSPLLSMVKDTDALVKGTWGADFIDEVKPLANEYIVESQRVGPFEGSNLEAVIKEVGAETVILYGVATNIVVETTARIASDKGYQVIVVEDCCSAGSPEAHNATLETLGLLTTITNLNELKESLKDPASPSL